MSRAARQTTERDESAPRGGGHSARRHVTPTLVASLLACHLCGLGLTAVALAYMVVGAESLQGIFYAGSDHLSGALSPGVARHLLYSAIIWLVVAISISRLKRRPKAQRTIRIARGQVLLETLIVLVPFLLLTGGLSQLIINNIAGMLAHMSAYQAGRTCWVWEQEAVRTNLSGASIYPINEDQVSQKARIAAAVVLTPVVSPQPGDTIPSELLPIASAMSGHFGTQAEPTPAPSAGSATETWSYAEAFDTGAFAKRAVLKLATAYDSTEASCEKLGDGTIKATVTYRHPLAFPWFKYIFADSPGSNRMEFVRSYTLPLQAPTN